jgi:hypothetical protein
VEISGNGKKRKQDETLNMEDHIWIKKGTKMYLKRKTGEVKIK